MPRLEASPIITHGEVSVRVKKGGCLRGVILEAQEDGPNPRFAVYLLSSWRKEYAVLVFRTTEQPRLFRDLDRIFGLVRMDYGFKGTVAVRLASDAPSFQQGLPITPESDLSRTAEP